MKICYRNKQIQKVCTNASYARKEYGSSNAVLIEQRIGELSAHDTVESLILNKAGRCHKLKGNLKDFYAVDLSHPLRMIFTVTGNEIQIARIEEIVDYH